MFSRCHRRQNVSSSGACAGIHGRWQPGSCAGPARQRGLSGYQLLTGGIDTEELNDGKICAGAQLLQAIGNAIHHSLLRRRQGWGGGRKLRRGEQRREAVVEIVEAFEIADDAFIGAQGTDGERLPAWLGDFNQAPVTQGALGRKGIPRGRIEEREGESKGGPGTRGVALGARAEGGDAGVEFHGGAEEQHRTLKSREAEAASEHDQGGRSGGLRLGLSHLRSEDEAVVGCRRSGCGACEQDSRGRSGSGAGCLGARCFAAHSFPDRGGFRLALRRGGLRFRGGGGDHSRFLKLAGAAFQLATQPCQGHGKVLSVGCLPVCLIAHVTFTCWVVSKTGGETVRLMRRLSTPSTLSRKNKVPAAIFVAAKVGLGVWGGESRGGDLGIAQQQRDHLPGEDLRAAGGGVGYVAMGRRRSARASRWGRARQPACWWCGGTFRWGAAPARRRCRNRQARRRARLGSSR